MRRRHHSFKEKILAILERVAELWANMFFRLVFDPCFDPTRLNTKEDMDEVRGHLFRADAHITRAIYKTARRLAGLPRIPCPIENFYRPKLKSARHIYWLYLNCVQKLQYHRRLAIRMAWRWKRANERKLRDPFCDLRDDLNAAAGACLPQSQSDWPDGLSRRSAAKAEGAGLVEILGARAPPRAHSTPKHFARALLLTSEVAGVCVYRGARA